MARLSIHRLRALLEMVHFLFGVKTQVSSKNFQGLLDHVTVLIGIAVGSEAVAGVIHQPYWNYQVGLHYRI